MYTNVYFFIHNNSLYSFIKQVLYKCNNISKISIVKINLTYLYHLSLRVIKIYYTLTHSEKKKKWKRIKIRIQSRNKLQVDWDENLWPKIYVYFSFSPPVFLSNYVITG